MSDHCAHCGTAGVHHCYAAEVKRLESRATELEAKVTRLAAERDDYENQRDEYRTRADRGEDRAAELEAALRNLVEAMPRCVDIACRMHGPATATRTGEYSEGGHPHWCDAHPVDDGRVMPRPDSDIAAPLRAALLLLGKGGTP